MLRRGVRTLAIVAVTLTSGGIGAPSAASALELATVGNFDSPTYVHGPRGANRLLFVTEQAGVIRMAKDDRKLGGRFLDIRNRVRSGGEQGLLSVAFAPNYRKNRRFYVYFTDRRGDLTIQEYRRSAKNPRRARVKSARTVLKIRHRQFSNHNGGQLQFGPDGFLYIGTGDGGGAGDTDGNAQNRRSLLGKILRINPRRSKGRPYTTPKGNPFRGRPGRREIFSLGLRNPWRFSFHRRRIAIGDVGQNRREEINYTTLKRARGGNFGWNAFEGSLRFDQSTPEPRRHLGPVHEYPTSGGNCAVTGGYISRDARNPSLQGRYLYADFCRGEIRSFVPGLDGARDDRPLGLPTQEGIASFGEARGRIYVVNLISGRVAAIDPS